MRLKFEMWKSRSRDRGVVSKFTDGTGGFTQSWWSSPPKTIDTATTEYLILPHRHPNVKSGRHVEFIKRRYKEEMLRLQAEGLQVD